MNPPAPDAAPRWYEWLVLAAGAVAAVVGLAGLTLALVGAHRSWAAVGAVVPAGVVWLLWRRRSVGHRRRHAPSDGGTGADPRPTMRGAHAAAAAALLIALGFTLWAAWAPSHHVLIDRDPGAYSATARWLARDGGLTVPARAGGLEDEELLRVDGLGVYDVGDGEVQFQFTHATAVLLAVAYDTAGPGGLFRAPALAGGLGLLALYAVSVRVLRRPWIGLLPPLLAATCLPLVYVGRDTFSEPFAFAMIWTALLAGLVAVERGAAYLWAAAGLVTGTAMAIRPDLLLAGAAFGPLLAAWVLGAQDPAARRRRGVGVATGMGFTAAAAGLGIVDLVTSTGEYASRHGRQVALGGALAAGSTVATALVVQWVRSGATRRDSVTRWAARAATPAGALVVAAGLAAWWVRPRIQVATGAEPVDLIAALQAMAGVAIEPTRRYGELSMVWVSWYLGPVALVAAIAGLGVAVRRIARGRASAGLAAVLLLALVVGGATLWRPSITPDHIWAMRRFVPVVLPAFVVLAALPVSLLAGRFDPPRWRVVAATVLGAAMVVGTVTATWPVRQLRAQHGYRAVLEEVCALAGPDASVVVVGAPEASVLAQPLRSWCGLPVASARRGVSAEQLGPVAEDVRARGRTLVVVAGDESELAGAPGAGPVRTTSVVADHLAPERTLLRPPARYSPVESGWSLAVRRVED